jgi:hypothetical protein
MGKSPGRPPFHVTPSHRRTVELLAAAGVPHDQIAALIGTTRPTLAVHFGAELNAGRERHLELADMKLGVDSAELTMRLFRQSQRRGPAALRAIIFLLRTRYGWAETLLPR